MQKVERLANTLRKNGFVYKLVQRTDKHAIYEQFYTAEESAEHWEVFKIRVRPARADAERLCKRHSKPFNPDNYPEYKESFPGDEDFGSTAWCYMKLEKAQRKFMELENGQHDSK